MDDGRDWKDTAGFWGFLLVLGVVFVLAAGWFVSGADDEEIRARLERCKDIGIEEAVCRYIEGE